MKFRERKNDKMESEKRTNYKRWNTKRNASSLNAEIGTTTSDNCFREKLSWLAGDLFMQGSSLKSLFSLLSDTVLQFPADFDIFLYVLHDSDFSQIKPTESCQANR